MFSRTSVLSALLVTCLPFAESNGEERVFTQKPTVETSREVDGRGRATNAARPLTDNGNLRKGPAANWIWGGKAQADDRYIFVKQFTTKAKTAQLVASCDNQMTVFLNGKQAASSTSWESPTMASVGRLLKPGVNRLEVRASNAGGPAGLALKLVLGTGETAQYVVTDASWKAKRDKTGAEKPVIALGRMGAAPWGDVFAGRQAPALLAPIPRNVFNVLPGFQVELLYTVPKRTQGSWVSMTFDDKGRILACDQGGQGLFRITPPKTGSDEETKVEKLELKISSAQGMLYAFNSLYLSINGGPGSGLYRATDSNGDDQFDNLQLLKAFRGGGEHGPHAIRLSPDGRSLFVVAGNHTDPPADFQTSRVPRNWGEDLLLPRQWDARGHARGKLAPGGWIAKTDPQGKNWEMFSIGYRNAYDMAFNTEGELFAYDADMEWDLGSPWYRPTRVVHATSGSEFGWRSGTGKWPTYYVDSLPPLVDIGPGSPVGVTFGYGARFPAKYQRALYLLDWTFGTIHAVHLTPDGASYTGVKEEFLSRAPLPLTDAAVGPDGGFYFTVGGRGTQSALYRVSYVGDESTAPAKADKAFAEQRKTRRELERLHSGERTNALDTIWDGLGSPDRHIQYAARTALEHQDVSLWRARLLKEGHAQRLILGAVALARQGNEGDQPRLLEALDHLDFAKLSERRRLALLRAYALIFVRQGAPSAEFAARLAKKLDAFYPARTDELNRELSRVLVYLDSPKVVSKTIAMMKAPGKMDPAEIPELLARNAGYGGTIAKMLANKPELQKAHYALVLRNVRYGWTLGERRDYLAWIDSAKGRSGGASYQGFLDNIRKEALANASEAERKALKTLALTAPPKESELPKPKGPGRKWTVDEVAKLAQTSLHSRDFEAGKRAYSAAKCISCHRFDGVGGSTGHDLTNLANRFSIRDLGESLIEPSKVISDQYRAMMIVAAGRVTTGRIIKDNKESIEVLTDPVDATKVVTIRKADIESMTPSKTSLMPTGLLETLNRDEVLDLLAYLLSRGNPQALHFR